MGPWVGRKLGPCVPMSPRSGGGVSLDMPLSLPDDLRALSLGNNGPRESALLA